MEASIYQPGDSIIHRLNPVTKIVVSICLTAIVFIIPDYRPIFGLVALLGVLVVVSQLYRIIFTLVGGLMIPFGTFLLIIQGVLNPAHHGTTALLTVGPVTFWEPGIEQALLVFSRVLVLVLSFTLMATTSPTREMRVALMEKGVPSKITYVFIASLQIIPQMRDRANSITEAQQARGMDTRASLRTRVKSVAALLSPLLISMLITAKTRALALEARGFNSQGDHQFLVEVPDPAYERAIRWVAISAVPVIILTRVVLWH